MFGSVPLSTWWINPALVALSASPPFTLRPVASVHFRFLAGLDVLEFAARRQACLALLTLHAIALADPLMMIWASRCREAIVDLSLMLPGLVPFLLPGLPGFMRVVTFVGQQMLDASDCQGCNPLVLFVLFLQLLFLRLWLQGKSNLFGKLCLHLPFCSSKTIHCGACP